MVSESCSVSLRASNHSTCWKTRSKTSKCLNVENLQVPSGLLLFTFTKEILKSNGAVSISAKFLCI